MSFAENLAHIQERLHQAATQAGRDPQSVRLIAVSKTKPVSQLQEAIEAGQLVFGENRVQEALEKQDTLNRSDLEWHLIGHLQKNKAKFCPGNFAWVHSVDSLELAQRLEKHCAAADASLKILLQLNTSAEESKSGMSGWDEVRSLAEQVFQNCPHLQLKGLMTIPAPDAGEGPTRQAFAQLRTWNERLQSELGLPELNELSMGMTSDFEWAILEGATLVRIGSALFGARAYP